MTREEARVQIVIFMNDEHEVINDRDREALDMAIKALEQEPCEDAVSRKYLLDKIHSEDGMEKIENSNLFAVHYANLVKSAPPVTPTRKKGKWVNGNPICPCCREDKFKDLDADIWADWQPKYCPNCGSFMEVKR